MTIGISRGLTRLVAACAAVTLAARTPAHAQSADMVFPDIARFAPPGYNPDVSGPSLALKTQLGPGSPLAADWKVRPVFSADAGKTIVSIPIAPGTSLYGTGEVAGPLLRNGRRITCWNTDAYGYDEKNPSLYQSHPWVLAVRKDGSAFGVLLDTTWRVEVETAAQPSTQAGEAIVFRAEGHPRPVYVIEGASPQDVIKGLARLTGTIEMPPRWALGYHQCRYSYNPEARVREIAQNFRDRDIPADVIWFDIDYMNEYRVFTFDKAQFPDPTRLNADLEAQGFRTVWMIDPGVKAEPGYAVYDQGAAADAWVKRAGGEVYKGEVWPGWCVFPDYTRPDVRTWWAGLYKDFMATGIDGVWNDMNEPAVFNVQSKTMPEDNAHAGGALDGYGNLVKGPHLQYHNVYGMLMAQGTRDGIMAANPDKRPFVLTRAGYLGSHRYAATWTGDNSAEWDDLEQSISMILNLGLSGQPFSGPDIGGFNGNGDAALFSRWIGVGSLLPFSRGHTGKGNINKEPWAFGPDVEATSRTALQRRYRLLPHFYTLFHEAHTTGLPVARPVFFADPADPALRSEDDAFLLGDNLLVVARTTPTGDRAPALPRGTWRPVFIAGETNANPDLPNLRVKAGGIIPLGPVMEYSSEKPLDPLTLIVSLDQEGKASGTLYEDAGDGWGFKQGEYLLTTYAATTSGKTVTVNVASAEGKMPRPTRRVEVRVLLDNGAEATGAGADGQPITIQLP
jgi:alpha-glucosidase